MAHLNIQKQLFRVAPQKHLGPTLFSNKAACLETVISLKKTLAQVFSHDFSKIFKNTFPQSTYGQLLQNVMPLLALLTFHVLIKPLKTFEKRISL